MEDLYCRRGCTVREIAEIYDISIGYLYFCLKQLYGSEWKKILKTKKQECEVSEIEEHVFCAAYC